MRARQPTAIGAFIAMLAGGVPAAVAQPASGGLTGVVRDQSGAPVPSATITVRDVSTNLSRSVESSAEGLYAVPGLAPGVYQVGISAAGFRPLSRQGVRLATGETARLDVDLLVGDLSETVTVSADAGVLRQVTAGLGQVVGQERIAGLPLNGRSFVSLATLAPGVAMPAGQAFPRINGGRPRTNEYLFDGLSVLQPEPGQIAFLPIIDAIQEFKIESNSPSAEFGRFNGGVVNLTTKAGSNALHGVGFEFLRHEALNARNFFASSNPVKPVFRRHQYGGTLGGPIRRDGTFFFVDYQRQRQRIGRTVISTVPTVLQRRGVFTEPIGGRVPVIYDPKSTTPGPSEGLVRTPFAGNMIPEVEMDPVAKSLLQRYPLPTAAGTANNYRRTADELDDQDQFDVRIDQRFDAGASQAFARLSYFHGTFAPVTPLPDGSGATTGTPGRQKTTAWAFASSYQRVFSDRWLNELRIGDTRRSVNRTAATLSGPGSGALRLPGLPSDGQFSDTLPAIVIGGYQQLGSPANTASAFGTSVNQIVNAVTWLKGRHTIKMGLDWRWERLNVIQPPSPAGAFTFSSLFTDLPGVANTGSPLASFLLGQVQTFSIDLQKQQIRNRARIQEYFIQDSWKVSDRLTINPGIRYTLNFPSIEENDQTAVFNLETRRLDYLGRDGNPRSARRLHWNNFGPRLGIAYRAGERTVLSAGYGLVWIEQAGITTPFTTPSFPFLQTVSQRTLDNVTPAFVLASGPTIVPAGLTADAGLGQGVFAVDRDLGSGYVQQWNLSWQRELTTNLALEVSYVGSKITRVGIPDTNVNQLTASQLALGPPLLQRVPNPYFGIVPRSSSLGDPTITVAQLLKPFPEYTTVSFYRSNVGTTFYQGLEARIDRRFAGGLSLSAAYTRSRLVDDASSVFDASILTGPVASYPAADSFNRALERDRSTGDIPNVLVSSVVWDLPIGRGRPHRWSGVAGAIGNDWTVTGLLTLQSGVPIPVTQATNFNAFAGFGVHRPNLVGTPSLPGGQRSVNRWFNTAAFEAPPPFTLGTASRNPVRGPSYSNVDLALIRRAPLWNGSTLELRAEIFNLLNTPPLGAPNTILGAANFGTITTAGDPRVVQLAFKVLF